MMSDVSCSGTESDIRTCVHANGTNSKCGHEEDAGVRCNYPKPTVQNVSRPSVLIMSECHIYPV